VLLDHGLAREAATKDSLHSSDGLDVLGVGKGSAFLLAVTAGKPTTAGSLNADKDALSAVEFIVLGRTAHSSKYTARLGLDTDHGTLHVAHIANMLVPATAGKVPARNCLERSGPATELLVTPLLSLHGGTRPVATDLRLKLNNDGGGELELCLDTSGTLASKGTTEVLLERKDGSLTFKQLSVAACGVSQHS
jgi:hypothetical protein